MVSNSDSKKYEVHNDLYVLHKLAHDCSNLHTKSLKLTDEKIAVTQFKNEPSIWSSKQVLLGVLFVYF